VAPVAESAFLSGIFFSKDRREEVIEVEEEPETEYIPAVGERVKLMTQNQWMKGCPEGGEQGFLFSLYSQLIEGNCPCPSGCGYSLPRAKHHFFPIFVRTLSSLLDNLIITPRTVVFRHIYQLLEGGCPQKVQEMFQGVLLCMWRANEWSEGSGINENLK